LRGSKAITYRDAVGEALGIISGYFKRIDKSRQGHPGVEFMSLKIANGHAGDSTV
jgi:hypothetical protein